MIGFEIVKDLKKQGRDVTVFVRATSNVEGLRALNVPTVTGDVLEPETLHQAFEDGIYETVVSAISRSGSFTPIDGVTIHKTGNNNITAAALLSGVKHVILMGTAGPGDSAGLLSERQRTSFKQIYADKTAAENFLMASGLSYTIIRTGIILTGAPTGKAQLTGDHSIRRAATIFDIANKTAECVGKTQCFNRVFHTFDPSIPPLNAEALQNAREDLRTFEAERRGRKTE